MIAAEDGGSSGSNGGGSSGGMRRVSQGGITLKTKTGIKQEDLHSWAAQHGSRSSQTSSTVMPKQKAMQHQQQTQQ